MSKPWPTKPLGELCNLINGRAFKPSDWGTKGLPIVRIQNLNDARKPFNYFNGQVAPNHLIATGEVLLSWSGTPGTSFGCFRWARGPGVLNQHIFKVIVDDAQIDSDFFIAAVNSRLDEMISKAHGGVGLRHITKSKLEAIHLPVPPLPEQRRIVTRIKECMERVEEIDNLRAKTKKEKNVLLESLIEGEFQSTIGDEVVLEEVCGITSELVDPRKLGYIESIHVGGANIESETGRLIDLKTSREEKLKSGKFPFDSSMVLYNKIRPYLKKVTRPDFSGICSADMYPLSPDPTKMDKDYLFFLLLSRDFTRYAIEGSNRAGMPKVNRKHLFAYRFNLPPIDQQKQIAEKLNEALTTLKIMRSEYLEMDANESRLRDAILRKAFAGEL